MAIQTPLVTAHLENVSGDVFEYYPEVIRDFIRGHAGVYALYKNDRLYYVGLARNLAARLKRHLQDRHAGKWNRFSVYLTVDDNHMKELESLLIRVSKPTGNRQRGRFAISENVKLEIQRRIKAADTERREKLLGSRTRRSRGSQESMNQRGQRGLKGLVDRRRTLRADYKGWRYRAYLRRDGYIEFDDYLYKSPTAAAKVIVKGRVNGWKFWKYRDPDSGWIPLSNLKK